MRTKAFQLFKKYNLELKKFLGQNFLINKKVLDKIISISKIKKTDNILEVGPGLGFLTSELVQGANKVVAVEIDEQLFFVLKQEFKKIKNLELIKEDILKLDFEKLKRSFDNKQYKIIANIPYQITSHFLKRFLTAKYHPQEMILMVQLEVAKRICVKPGKHSLLSLSAQFYSDPEIIEKVDPESFFPKPKVSSAIIKLKNIQKKVPKVDEKLFFRLLKIGFSAKRKQLQNNLANGFHENKEKTQKILKNLGFSSQIRAQEMTMQNWIKLYKKLVEIRWLK